MRGQGEGCEGKGSVRSPTKPPALAIMLMVGRPSNRSCGAAGFGLAGIWLPSDQTSFQQQQQLLAGWLAGWPGGWALPAAILRHYTLAHGLYPISSLYRKNLPLQSEAM